MIEIEADGLDPGDTFTPDHGENWYSVLRVTPVRNRVVVVAIHVANGIRSEKVYKSGTLVVVRT